MSWLAIWDGRKLTQFDKRARAADLSHGTIRFEMTLRGEIQVPVILWQGRTGTTRDLRIICRPNGAVCVEQGAFVFETDAGFLFSREPLLLHFTWDRLGKTDQLVLTNTQTGTRVAMRPGSHAPRSLAEIVPETPGPMVSVAYAGIANHPLPEAPLPGMEKGTLIQTPTGPVAVGDLQPGMQVLTGTGTQQTVRWVGTADHMARGTAAPIRLRAPYFGLTEDITVTRNQRLLLTGCEVEYLFGEEQVLARVEDIRRANAAQICLEQPTITICHVLLDDHDCLLAGRCALDTALLSDVLDATGKSSNRLADPDRIPAWTVIDRAGAQAYLEMLTQNRPAAA